MEAYEGIQLEAPVASQIFNIMSMDLKHCTGYQILLYDKSILQT